ncbi:MAG: acetate/propionate family kinase, partial [Candidatus Altimarinota bacterium]
MKILILNSGSSSLKFQIFEVKKSLFHPIAKGVADAIGQSHAYLEVDFKNQTSSNKTPLKNHQQALQKIFQYLKKQKIIVNLQEIQLVGHRFVHGGEKYYKPVHLTAKIIKDLQKLSDLAPLHNPANLSGIKGSIKLLPKAFQVAVFDTGFHHTLSPVNYLYALPKYLYKKFCIRRYGFHGINHQSVSEQAIKILKKARKKSTNLITCHLGNGVSLAAIKNGKSVDTTMGFTPLEGIIMGTRSGSIDPSIPLELCQRLNKTPQQILNLLNKESGLLAISGKSSDMRLIYAGYLKKDPACILAMEMYCHSIAKHLASLVTNLGSLDAIIFTAGIGENADYVRQKVCQQLAFLNLKLSSAANSKNQTIISTPDSKITVLIIPAREESKIAEQTLKL